MKILNTYYASPIIRRQTVQNTGFTVSKPSSNDTFVSNNSKTSFKSKPSEEYDRYCKNYTNFSYIVPREIYKKIDEVCEASTFIQEKMDKWEDVKTDSESGVRFGFQNGKLRAAVMYNMLDTQGAGYQWMPKSVTLYNKSTNKPESFLKYGITMFLHSEAPILQMRTDYYNDGKSPKLRINCTNAGSPVPWNEHEVIEYDINGNIKKKYYIRNGLEPQITVEQYDTNGRQKSSTKFSIPY